MYKVKIFRDFWLYDAEYEINIFIEKENIIPISISMYGDRIILLYKNKEQENAPM